MGSVAPVVSCGGGGPRAGTGIAVAAAGAAAVPRLQPSGAGGWPARWEAGQRLAAPLRRLREVFGPLVPQNGTWWLRRSERAALGPVVWSQGEAQSRT